MNDQFPFGYERIAATTWAYLSSLLMLCVFFKFNRFWSVRNFDLLLIILLAPGILLYEGGRQWVARDAAAAGQASPSVVVQPDGSVSINSAESQAPDPVATPMPAGSGPNAESADPRDVRQSDEVSGREESSGESNTEQTEFDAPPAVDPPGDTNAGDEEDDDEASSALAPEDKSSRGYTLQRIGFYWLLSIAILFLIRMLLDPLLVRRPLLEPNMTIGGLVFMGCSLMIFLFANIITAQPNDEDLSGARDAVRLLQREAAGEDETLELQRRGPGYRLFNLFPIIPSFSDENEIRDILESDPDRESQIYRYVIAAKSLAIASQNFIVLGLVFFGFLHFKSFKTGVAMAVIYLMLPYTAVFTGHVMHALPAALLIWALVFFHRPGLAGIFLGLATGVTYYPLFLLPLWISFYWEKGRTRFLTGFFCSLAFCIAGLVFTSYDLQDFVVQLQTMFGFWLPQMEGLEGIWALGWDDVFRIPVMVAFLSLSISFAFWPTQKNVGTLIAYTCAIMVAVQFWHGFGGGLYMAWYVPLALMAIFRPNTDGRVASLELAVAEENRRLRGAEMSDELLPVD